MIISVNWMKKFTNIDLPIDELVKLIGARIVEIEKVVDLGTKYKDVIVVRVVECAPLEGTDHLNLTKIDDGGVWKNVERDAQGLVQVVCGATNVKSGMLAAWLPPESTVPDSFDNEPFVLTAKNLKGVISNGMLASAKELDLYDDHTGILEIDKEVEPGTLFAVAYELDDYLLDIENKSLTHRPDTFGIIGFAREVAAIQGKAFITPEWLAELDPTYGDKQAISKDLKVTIDKPELCARYQAVVMSEADASRKSPLQTQTYLSRVGVRPINAVVDVTNYLMMLTGQPLHAFDYDKLLAVCASDVADIHVRVGRQDEELELLDGRTIKLSPDDIVISAGDKAVGLAGAMGGLNTVIDKNTKNIIIESATFNLYNLRTTQMRHGIFSEAITRFTKGQPAELTAPVLADAIDLLEQWASAKRVSNVAEATGLQDDTKSIEVSAHQVNRVLGTDLKLDEIDEILQSVEFATVAADQYTLAVAPPYWRADVHVIQDVIEEIGRLKGFDSITPTLPFRDFTAIAPSAFDDLRARIRRILARAGANEVLTYSFIHGDIIKKVGQTADNSYKIVNSLSPDLQYYRQSLTQGLLGLVYPNIKQGFDSFALFELNKVHPKVAGVNDEGMPVEIDAIALTLTNKKTPTTSAYYQAKVMLDYLADNLGLKFKYEPFQDEPTSPGSAPFEYRRGARVVDDLGNELGIVGEYRKSVSRGFKLPDYTAGFEIDARELFSAVARLKPSYKPLSRYPGTERDICFQVESGKTYAEIVDEAQKVLSLSELETNISPVDIYQPDDGNTKNITIRISLVAMDHTLTSIEANDLMKKVSDSVIKATGATVI